MELPQSPLKTIVIGSGNFGTALAHHLANKGEDVVLWSRRPSISDSINRDHQNPDYLKGVHLSKNLIAVTSLNHFTNNKYNIFPLLFELVDNNIFSDLIAKVVH